MAALIVRVVVAFWLSKLHWYVVFGGAALHYLRHLSLLYIRSSRYGWSLLSAKACRWVPFCSGDHRCSCTAPAPDQCACRHEQAYRWLLEYKVSSSNRLGSHQLVSFHWDMNASFLAWAVYAFPMWLGFFMYDNRPFRHCEATST